MSDPQAPDTLSPPVLSAGGTGSEEFWKNHDRQNDTEYLHHLRMAKVHQRNTSFTTMTFQSQMLGLMLLGESEMSLLPGGEAAQASAPGPEQPDPTLTP